MRRILAAVAIALCCVSTGASAASAGDTRYRVTIRDTEIASVDDIAASLVATYGGEVSNSDSISRSFVLVTTPERAKLLLESRAVARVEALGGTAHSSRMATNTQVDLGTYTYDGSGNIRFIGTDVYQYDKVSRLGSATESSVTQSYTYDGFGNLSALVTAGGVLCAGNVDCGRTVTISSATNRITSNGAHYTDAGSLDANDGFNYTYDDLGMMTQQRIGASIVRQFVYTADDERIATYLPSGAWNWTVRDLSGAVLRTFTSQDAGTVLGTANWQWGEDYIYRGPLLLATKGPQGVRHLHLDHLGTPRLITDDAGHQLGIHKYLPFGAELNIGTRENPEEARKFTGHERDGANSASTLDYMHARYYGWGMGRFLSVDSASGHARTPQSWNRYLYASNSPVTRFDADGRKDSMFIVNTLGGPAFTRADKAALDLAVRGTRFEGNVHVIGPYASIQAAQEYGALGDSTDAVAILAHMGPYDDNGNPMGYLEDARGNGVSGEKFAATVADGSAPLMIFAGCTSGACATEFARKTNVVGFGTDNYTLTKQDGKAVLSMLSVLAQTNSYKLMVYQLMVNSGSALLTWAPDQKACGNVGPEVCKPGQPAQMYYIDTEKLKKP